MTVRERYDLLLSKCAVRTVHVLQEYRSTFDDDDRFFLSLAAITRKEIKSLRNCGNRTAEEIINLSKQLGNYMNPSTVLPSNIDLIFPLLIQQTATLSTRAKNAIILLFQENDNSVAKFHSIATSRFFKAGKIRNIGRGTEKEISDFIDSAIQFIEGFSDEQAVELAANRHSRPSLSGIEHNERIQQLHEDLGHFPLFAAVSLYLDGLDDVLKTIAHNRIRIHDGRGLTDLKDSLGFTKERIRQKREDIITNLAEYLADIRNTIGDNPYRYMTPGYHEEINRMEGTDFSQNFAGFILKSTFDGINVVGNMHKALTNVFYEGYDVTIVPAELSSYFDFDAFEDYITQKTEEKRINDEKADLHILMSQFCRKEHSLQDTETACRAILRNNFSLEVDMDTVIFKANMRKSNYIVVEEILRDSGQPMTLAEIHEEFIHRHPDRQVDINAFRGTVNNNDNIVPIGRSSTYTLKEWDITVNRGGTIRTFVDEYLDSLETPIAPTEKVCEYVRRFRPDTTDSSILSNLSQEKDRKYGFYRKDRVKYIGYNRNEYDPSYTILTVPSGTDESMALLKEFVETHYRYPLPNNENEEELHLYRFVENMRIVRANGNMNRNVAERWKSFEMEHSRYRLKMEDAEAVDALRRNLEGSALPEGFSSFAEYEKKTVDSYIATLTKRTPTKCLIDFW